MTIVFFTETSGIGPAYVQLTLVIKGVALQFFENLSLIGWLFSCARDEEQ